MERFEKIDIPRSVKEIGTDAFADGPKTINIPEGSKCIEVNKYGVFSLDGRILKVACDYGAGEYVVPDGVVEIEAGAFSNLAWTPIYSITIANGVTEIKDEQFWGLNFTTVKLPDSIRRIGNEAFSQCEELESINIPESVEYIEDAAFACCYKLKSITIPSRVKKIGHAAFAICRELSEVWLLGQNLHLDKDVFDRCKALTAVHLPAGVKHLIDYCEKNELPYVED